MSVLYNKAIKWLPVLAVTLAVASFAIAADPQKKQCTPTMPSCITYLQGLLQEQEENPRDPYVLLRLARAYRLEGDVRQTLKYLDEYLIQNSDDANVTLEAAKIAASIPDFNLAEKYYQKALGFGQQQDVIHYHLGLLYLNNDKPEAAIEQYSVTLQENPDDPDALANIGLAYLKTGQLKKAVTNLHRATQLEPQNPDRFNMLGLAYLQMDKLDDAIKALSKAVKLKPESIAYHYNLGEAYREKSMSEQSIYHYDEALQHKAVTADDWFNQGKVNFRLGLYDDAIRIYQSILPKYTDRIQQAQVYLAMGYAYEALDNGTLAKAAFNNYLNIIPTGHTAEAIKLRVQGLK